jgi:hypothetical protein
MKSLKQISAEQTLAVQAEKKQVLDAVKKQLVDAVNFARDELPKIEAALAEADIFRRQNIDSIDWKAMGGLPKSIANLLFEIDRLRGNPGALREMLRRYDALTWRDAWGNRTDGTRDVNQAATLRGSFNFLLARGCVSSIEEKISRLKAEIARIEERVAWNNGETLSPEVRLIAVPPAHSGEVTVINNLTHD